MDETDSRMGIVSGMMYIAKVTIQTGGKYEGSRIS